MYTDSVTRQRLFLDTSCVDAARERVRHVIETHDSWAVQVSGGKDSVAVLLLVKQIHDEMGLGKVTVIHRDEEMVSPAVVEYMEWIRALPWVNYEHYCLPVGQEIWCLGRREYTLLWSAQRAAEGRLVRDIPDYAIRAEHFGLDYTKPIPESIDYYQMQGKQGRVAFFTGVRANESMLRYRSVTQKLHENYLSKPFRLKRSVPLWFAKVIYDWTTDDVFKFLDDHDFPYCEYYDLAAMTGANTRVGIPLHSVAIRRINDVVRTEPEFYDRLVECFPQIDAQRKWWAQFDVETLIKDYAALGWDGIKQLIEENMLTPGIKRDAYAFAGQFRDKQRNSPSDYPLTALARTLLLNEFSNASPSPSGPGTRSYTLAKQMEDDADGLDAQDDEMPNAHRKDTQR